MKKFMNSTETMLRESLSGFAQCHRDIVALDRDFRFVSRKQVKRGKVALISGGGSGHEPLHTGFVGHGMLDAACPGQVFTSPTPDQMVAAAEAVETGAGMLFIVKNYAGDVMNFALAAEMCGGDTDTLVIDDDVAVENVGAGRGAARRRGNGGRGEGGRRSRGSGSRRRRAEASRRLGERGDALDGCGAHELHGSGGRETDVRHRRRRNGSGRGDPWRARPPPRRPHACRRDR